MYSFLPSKLKGVKIRFYYNREDVFVLLCFWEQTYSSCLLTEYHIVRLLSSFLLIWKKGQELEEGEEEEEEGGGVGGRR